MATLVVVAMEIMSAPTSLRIPTLAVFLVSGLAVSGLAADLTLQKVPPLTVEQAPRYPQNLARIDLGTQIVTLPANSSNAERALLSSDPTTGFDLNSGSTTLMVSLPKIENVETVSFLNSGARGTVSIATASAKLAADSPQWKTVAEQEVSGDDFSMKIGPGEAKYVRLSFKVTEAGKISGLGVYSTPGVSDFTMPRSRQTPGNDYSFASYNLADLHTKTRALYVSSGDDLKAANNMIDDQSSTSYMFAADDSAPATIIDLGRTMSLRRITALFSKRAGTVQFYVLNAIPTTGADSTVEVNPASNSPVIEGTPSENAPSTLRLDDGALAGLTAVATSDDGSSGRVAVDFPETSGRYILVRWAPAASQANFSVAEIAAFGSNAGSQSTLVAANTAKRSRARTAVDESDSKTVRTDAKDVSKDVSKDVPAEGPQEDVPAEGPPPGLPQPPPFVFVPEILPTSP